MGMGDGKTSKTPLMLLKPNTMEERACVPGWLVDPLAFIQNQ